MGVSKIQVCKIALPFRTFGHGVRVGSSLSVFHTLGKLQGKARSDGPVKRNRSVREVFQKKGKPWQVLRDIKVRELAKLMGGGRDISNNGDKLHSSREV